MITFRYSIQPTREQGETLARHVETCRRLYNRLLGELNRAREAGTPLSWVGAVSLLPGWKHGDFPEMKDVHSRVAMMVARQLFANLASLGAKKNRGRKVGRLRFKGRGWYNSLAYNQSGFTIEWARGAIRLSKVGEVPARFHRVPPPGHKVKGVVVKRTGTGKCVACLHCEEPGDKDAGSTETLEARVEAVLDEGGHAVGIDLGIAHFAADSDGNFVASPQHLEFSLAKVKRLQKKLSRKKKASNRRQKAKFVLAKLHEKVANQRRDFLHKLSRYYVANYDVICAEDLAVAGMLQEKRAGFGKKANTTL
ncbi:MAG TPA: RNA-guided endonuclease TnpB family protein, partial [Candidatus Lokiarchaeia archaeon]|nr:RNA-guided endonuclease TnpB family protein [Candidatus Lokiarchaeia archaeon]